MLGLEVWQVNEGAASGNGLSLMVGEKSRLQRAGINWHEGVSSESWCIQ